MLLHSRSFLQGVEARLQEPQLCKSGRGVRRRFCVPAQGLGKTITALALVLSTLGARSQAPRGADVRTVPCGPDGATGSFYRLPQAQKAPLAREAPSADGATRRSLRDIRTPARFTDEEEQARLRPPVQWSRPAIFGKVHKRRRTQVPERGLQQQQHLAPPPAEPLAPQLEEQAEIVRPGCLNWRQRKVRVSRMTHDDHHAVLEAHSVR